MCEYQEAHILSGNHGISFGNRNIVTIFCRIFCLDGEYCKCKYWAIMGWGLERLTLVSQLHHGIGWTIVISMYFPIPIVNRIGRTILVSSSNSYCNATMSASNGQYSEYMCFLAFFYKAKIDGDGCAVQSMAVQKKMKLLQTTFFLSGVDQ